MRLNPEGFRYALTTPVALLQPAVWLIEKIAGPIIPATAVPLLQWASTAAGLMFIGFVIADLTNPGTGLSEWFRRRRKVFEARFHPAAEERDGKECNTPYFTIIFTKRTRVGIELMLYENIQRSIKERPRLILKIDPKRYSDGETLKIPIATIPRDKNSSYASHWASDPTKRMLFHTGNLVVVRATKNLNWGAVIQTYSVFISYGECDDATGKSYFYLPEDRYVFAK